MQKKWLSCRVILGLLVRVLLTKQKSHDGKDTSVTRFKKTFFLNRLFRSIRLSFWTFSSGSPVTLMFKQFSRPLTDSITGNYETFTAEPDRSRILPN